MAVDEDSTSGKLTPADGSQWAELLARLGSPLHHWGCQDVGSPLVDSIGGGDLTWVGGAGDAYQKIIPGWTRKACGYLAPGPAPFGDWRNTGLGDPSIDDDGTGTGSVLIFLVGRQRVSSPPAGGVYGPFVPRDNYSYMLSYAGCELSAGTTTITGTNSQTRYRARVTGAGSTADGIILESPDGSHADNNVHAFLMQVRELDASSIEISLDTDLVSLVAQAGSPGAGALTLSGASTLILPAYREDGGPVNFDFLDVWIWRGETPLTPEERIQLLTDLKWREAYIPPGLRPLYWGPMFPDARGPMFTAPASPATLALSGLGLSSDALVNATIRARAAGPAGNNIRITFDPVYAFGDEVEENIGGDIDVIAHFDGDTATAGSVASMINGQSTLVEIVGTWSPDEAMSTDDSFSEVHLEGGQDARTRGPLAFWGPHFPDRPGGPGEVEEFIPGTGPAGVATFALQLEDATLQLTWITNVFKSYSGLERRASNLDDPKQVYSGSTYLLGDDALEIRNQLARYAALGSPFLLGLPFEEIIIEGPGEDDAPRSFRVSADALELLDWANPGQRVVVMSADGSEFVEAVLQAAEDDTMWLDLELGELGRYGSRVQPAVAVYLEPQQGFTRWPHPSDRVEQWNMTSRAALFGFLRAALPAELSLEDPVTVSSAMQNVVLKARSPGVAGNDITVEFNNDALTGDGELQEDTVAKTVVVKFLDGDTTVQMIADLINVGSSLIRMTGTWLDDGSGDSFPQAAEDQFGPTNLAGGTDESPATMGVGVLLKRWPNDNRIIWDRGIDMDATVADSIQAMNEIVDLGGAPISIGMAEVPDWGRQLAMSRSNDAEQWQWLKAFLFAVRGRQRSFWVPSFRNDLFALSDGPGGTGVGEITIDSTHGDFFFWWPTRKMIQIEQDEGFSYVEIINAVDNGDGTITCTIRPGIFLDPPGPPLPPASPITSISWMELCRLERDEVSIQFKNAGFIARFIARGVQQ